MFFVSPEASYKTAFIVTLVAFEKKRICESSSFLLKCIHSYIGCICKNVFLWVLKLPTKMHSQLHWLHLEKRICESSAFLHKCICSYTGCICEKKTFQCQWSLASQEKWIGFVGFGLCFDLLGPKFLIRARRLKKGARGVPKMFIQVSSRA